MGREKPAHLFSGYPFKNLDLVELGELIRPSIFSVTVKNLRVPAEHSACLPLLPLLSRPQRTERKKNRLIRFWTCRFIAAGLPADCLKCFFCCFDGMVNIFIRMRGGQEDAFELGRREENAVFRHAAVVAGKQIQIRSAC